MASVSRTLLFNTIIEYGYDALDRRRWRRETLYFWAGETLIGEVEQQWGKVIWRQEYLFQPGTHTLLATRVNGQVYYCHTDHTGTPCLLMDLSGQLVVERSAERERVLRHLYRQGSAERRGAGAVSFLSALPRLKDKRV